MSPQEGRTQLGWRCGIFKYTSCLSGEKSEAGALSCSPQETLKPNCCSQQLLRADPDPYSASSWLLSVNR